MHRSIVIALLAASTVLLAQTRPAGREPGELPSTQPTRPATTQVTFTHPQSEIRGVWIASSDLLGPRDLLLKKLDQIKSANFNMVMIDCWFRGYTAYPGSAIAPQYPAFHGEDVFGLVVKEAHARGLHVAAWMEYGFYAYFTPDAAKDRSMGKILDADPDLVSINARGEKVIHRSVGDFYSLCPSNPRSHDILASLAAEVVSKYPAIDSLHLDRIRYVDADYCLCDYCKNAFKTEWPHHEIEESIKDPRRGGWLMWKRERSTRAVTTIASAVRKVRPKLVITSYVVGPDEMDARAQAWDVWASRGIIDAVAVSMYDADIRPAGNKALARLGDARSRLICAISTDGIPADMYTANVQIAREYSPLGQFTWYLGRLEDDDFAGLRAGPYALPANDPIKLLDRGR